MNSSTILLVLVAVLAIQVAAQNFGRTGQSLSRPPLFDPAGLDYVPDFGFILGSRKYGNLYFVEDGHQIQLFSNDTSLVSSTGVRVDANRRLVYVANNASPLSNSASILSFSKKDGSLKASWNLSKLLASQKPKQLANVAFDTLGNLYATDCLNGVVYLADRNGEASVWIKDIRLLPQDSLGVGVNGIYFYQGSDSSSRGYFLLTRSGNSEKASGLYRADIASKDLIRVTVDHGNYTGLFGSFSSVVVNPRSGRAFAIASDNLIYELSSTDDYQTAVLTAQYRVVCQNPVALQYLQSPYNDLYVLCNSGSTPYTIERVAVLNKINIIPFDNTRTTSSSAMAISVSLVLMVVLAVVSLV